MTTVGDHATSTLAHTSLSADSCAFRPAQLTENAQVVVEKRYLLRLIPDSVPKLAGRGRRRPKTPPVA